MTESRTYDLAMTTQGPLYPPSEVMNADGDFVVIGAVNRPGPDGGVVTEWGSVVVSADSPLPPFGQNLPYTVVRELGPELSEADREMVLCTLPLPLPCSNYTKVFAPDQEPAPFAVERPSHPFHQVPIPDLQPEDGPKLTGPVTLGQWVEAQGTLTVSLAGGGTAADFRGEFSGLIPDSLYTVMSVRVRDLDPDGPAHPSPLGVPNVFVTDAKGVGHYDATLPNPFPAPGTPEAANRIVNVIVLWMSHQRSYGGAIGHHGLGGDVHAQLRMPGPSFTEFVTHA
ncbi:hypothetical protein [Kitasatospora sp. NPDC057015]|uniref:hypothetical protein n=1 Tax=Kitasatospora sp. NPDC057015 TaxID=3346001 RepID=UPI003628A2C3